MIANLGYYNGPKNNITKTVTYVKEADCKVVDGLNVIRPELILSATEVFDENINYVSFNNRSYFVSNILHVNNKITKIVLEEDVLSTWYDRVTINGIINKSTTNYNMLLNQNTTLQTNNRIKRILFDENAVDIEGNTVVLQTLLPYVDKTIVEEE